MASSSPLGVSERHSEVIMEFLKFARSRRGKCLKAVTLEFQNFIESRLMEDTFTSEEVREMITELCSLVKAEMESELIHASHTHSLLVTQLLKRAEEYHLTMSIDTSSLENKELLETLAHYEAHNFNPATLPTVSAPNKPALTPLDHSAGEKLLHMEISRLETENAKLSERLQSVQSMVSGALGERDELKRQLEETTPTSATPTTSHSNDDDVVSLQETVAKLQVQLLEKETASSTTTTPTTATDVEKELEERGKELLKTRAELEDVRRELEKKFSDTAQYMNLMKMLSTKNDQIRELRAQLNK